MFCFKCGAQLPEDAKFCPKCGTPVAAPQEGTPQVDTGGGAFIGASASAGQDFIGRDKVAWRVERIEGDLVLNIGQVTPEMMTQLMSLKTMSTALKPEERSTPASAPAGTQAREVSDILAIVHQAESQGARVRRIQVGGQELTTAELLLKRAILLKSDAEQMFYSYAQRNAGRIQAAHWQSIFARAQINPRHAFSDFDWPTYDSKLREAQALLQGANEIEPTNAEVLLHMAQVQSALEPDNKEAFRKLVYRVTQLLSSPRTREEQFWLAQATFMMAFADQQVNLNFLRSARDKFAQLGETLWVQYCDALAQAQMAMIGFQPSGQWQFRNADGSVATVIFQPDGACNGTVQNMLGWGQFIGTWSFDAASQTLYVQGWINGTFPFQNAIRVQGQQQPGVFLGLAADGSLVTFWRIG